MKAVKASKEYTSSEQEKAAYVKRGFDIYESGKLVESGAGSTVSAKEYEALQKEVEKLKKENAKLKKEEKKPEE